MIRYAQGLENRPAGGMEAITGPKNVADLERWASVGAGAGLLLFGLRGGLLRMMTAGLVGGALIYRGITGHCPMYATLGLDTAEDHTENLGVPAQQGVKIEKTVTVHRSVEQVYRFWRNLENLPRFMSHLVSVQQVDDRHSHWVAKAPLGASVEWDAEIINEREYELIAWRSIPGSAVDTAGSVHFEELPDDRSTRIRISLKYNPVAGKLGIGLASLLGEDAESMIEQDLEQFKRLMETGEGFRGEPLAGGLEHTGTHPTASQPKLTE